MSSTEETTLRYSSCTPHRPKTRYHIVFEDFVDICVDIYNAHALRAFENATNQRIAYLRETYGIPETCLPHEDDLWVSMPYRALEVLTLKAVTKSTCQRILAEEAVEDMPPSLIELGFIRRRFAARRTNESRKRPLTTIYKDSDGEFILVDESGSFIDLDGLEQSAMMYGFGLVERQYLYCIEAVNTAIAALDYLEPPQPLPRCDEPTIRRCVPRPQKSSAATKEAAQETTSRDAQCDANRRSARTVARRGTNPYAISVNPHDSTDLADMSRAAHKNLLKMEKPVKQLHGPLYRDAIDATALRTATLTPETIIGLSSSILDVPAKPGEDDEEALQRWLADWYEPAVRLIAATSDLSGVLAWERIDLTMRYMATPGSPSWWQRGKESGLDWRKTKAPVTLRNVADHYFIQYADLRKQQTWWPEQTTPYDGPPPEYEAGYGGDTQPTPPIEAEVEELAPLMQSQATQSSEEPREPTTGEVVAMVAPVAVIEETTRSPGMNRATAEHLGRRIQRRCPGITLDVQPATEDASRVYVGIEVTAGQWFYFGGLSEWLRPSPEVAALIEKAVVFNTGMSVDVAAALIERIKDRYEGLIVKWCYAREDSERVIVSIEYARDVYWDLYDPGEWSRRTKEQQQLIEQAALYAATVSGGNDPPPQVESETNDTQGENRADHSSGAMQAAMGPS
jgi:hypothetical protein